MSEIVKVRLGDREFEIDGLTIRQCRDLRIGDATLMQRDDGAGGWSNVYDLAIKTISCATGVPEEELWKLSATEDQIAAARKAILKKAGFVTQEPTIAELRASVVAKKNEIAELEKIIAAAEPVDG